MNDKACCEYAGARRVDFHVSEDRMHVRVGGARNRQIEANTAGGLEREDGSEAGKFEPIVLGIECLCVHMCGRSIGGNGVEPVRAA